MLRRCTPCVSPTVKGNPPSRKLPGSASGRGSNTSPASEVGLAVSPKNVIDFSGTLPE